MLLLVGLFFSNAAFSSGALGGLPPSEGPVEVIVSFDLREIDHIDDDAETFEFTGVLKMTWYDPRQRFDPEQEGVSEKIYQGVYQFNEVFVGWFPQMVLINESGLSARRGVLLRVSPDGWLSLYETVNSVAKVDLDLRRYPVDRQNLDAVFHVLGFDEKEIQLVLEGGHQRRELLTNQAIKLPQWELNNVTSSIGARRTPLLGPDASTSTFTLGIEVQRNSFFVMRLVTLPLIIIVMLSWSVFWMDKSSLGDRLSVSFIGILTAVTYQVILSEILPRISYATLMNDGFLLVSFCIMSLTVIINLRVGYLDRMGRAEEGDRLDYACRKVFPLGYVLILLLLSAVALL